MYIIDRFEGDIAVIETPDGKYINARVSELPKGAKPSDALVKTGGVYLIDEKATAVRREYIKNLYAGLKKRKIL